jgi:hypothetical protein
MANHDHRFIRRNDARRLSVHLAGLQRADMHHGQGIGKR